MMKTKLPISFGLSINKLVAKMATDEAKPCGELFVPQEKVQSFLDPLPVGKIPFVGEKMVQGLNSHGIFTVADLRLVPRDILEKQFGRHGTYLWEKARGMSSSEVVPSHSAKGISMERTYDENIDDKDRLSEIVFSMAELLSADLRYEGKLCCTVGIKMRFPDFETITRQTSVPATASQVKLIQAVCELFEREYKPSYQLRLIGVRFGNLIEGGEQTDFFHDTEKEVKLHRAVDELREKYGKRKVHAARSVKV